MRKQIATDEQLIKSYAITKNVWKTAEEFGMCGQNVHKRLTKLGVIGQNLWAINYNADYLLNLESEA